MSQKENIDQLIQIIHSQNAWYLEWIFGLLGVIGIFLGFYSYQQKKISDKQVNKFNEKINSLEKIIEDLKYSNESTLNYSLVAMSREAFGDATSMEVQLKSYEASKEMYKIYYGDNKEIERNLGLAARSVVLASENDFAQLLKKDGTDVDDASDSVKKAYVKDINKKIGPQLILNELKFGELSRLGANLKNEATKEEWFEKLSYVNKFWKEEVSSKS